MSIRLCNIRHVVTPQLALWGGCQYFWTVEKSYLKLTSSTVNEGCCLFLYHLFFLEWTSRISNSLRDSQAFSSSQSGIQSRTALYVHPCPLLCYTLHRLYMHCFILWWVSYISVFILESTKLPRILAWHSKNTAGCGYCANKRGLYAHKKQVTNSVDWA